MKIQLITLLLLLSIPILSQEIAIKKISVGVSYSPNYSFRSISNTPAFLEPIRDDDKAIYGQSLSLIFRYGLNNHMAIESGISFQDRGFKMQMNNFSYFYGYDPAIPDKMEYVDRFNYLGIPVKFTLIKELSHISLVSSLGFIGNILLKSEELSKSDFGDRKVETTNNTTSEYHSFVLSAVVGAGIEWRIKNNYKFILMPTYQRDLTPISDGDMKHYLWDFGLNMGLLYEF